MRKIKFRAWDKGLKVMNRQYEYEGRLYIEHGQEIGHVLANNERFRIMQFTGLKDKNGKEIYEGDILKFSRYWADHFNQELTKVFWFNEDASFQFSHSIVDYTSIGVIVGESEIIGNIYENPEMLNP